MPEPRLPNNQGMMEVALTCYMQQMQCLQSMQNYMMHSKGTSGAVVAAHSDVVRVDMPPPVAAPPQLPVLLHVATCLCDLQGKGSGTSAHSIVRLHALTQGGGGGGGSAFSATCSAAMLLCLPMPVGPTAYPGPPMCTQSSRLTCRNAVSSASHRRMTLRFFTQLAAAPLPAASAGEGR